MNISDLSADTLRNYIPNVLEVAEGEPTLFEKLKPFIATSKRDIESHYIGTDDFLSEADNADAIRLVVIDALANAIPSLDLVITPTGFGVVNTNNLAPASKERVERLISSLRQQYKSGLSSLLRTCRSYAAWRCSAPGKLFCATLLRPLDDIEFEGCSFTTVSRLISEARAAEAVLADMYLGHSLLNELRRISAEEPGGEDVQPVSLARLAVVSMAVAVEKGQPLNSTQVWRLARNIILSLVFFKDLEELRKNDQRLAAPEPFVNDVKGGYVF